MVCLLVGKLETSWSRKSGGGKKTWGGCQPWTAFTGPCPGGPQRHRPVSTSVSSNGNRYLSLTEYWFLRETVWMETGWMHLWCTFCSLWMCVPKGFSRDHMWLILIKTEHIGITFSMYSTVISLSLLLMSSAILTIYHVRVSK